jgi:imidazolonepropionase-like amidohydrolase
MDAICGEARKRNLRVAVHAHGIESVVRAVRAGCTSVEHGALVDQATLDLMAEHGTYFDPNTDLIFRNYFENKSRFLDTPGYTEEGFAAMEKAVPRVLEVFKKGLRTKNLKIVFGTDALAGSHGRNVQELVYRVPAARTRWPRSSPRHPSPPNRFALVTGSARSCRGTKPT